MDTLDQLRPGQTAEVLAIEGTDAVASRLRELGFLPGYPIRMLRAAPLGDPLKYSVQGSRIALRAAEARRVRIRLAAS